MRELEIKECLDVSGGAFIVVVAVVAASSYAAGYVYGALTKEKPKPEPCKPNKTTGQECA